MKITLRGRVIDIEIQLSNQGNFQSRALYYWARMFSQSLDSGENFNLLPEAIVISFIDFNLFECAEYHSSFRIKEDVRNEILTNKFAIHFFELPKIPQNINENKEIELWLKLIGAETYEELHELEQSKNKEIKEALDYVKKLNSNETLKRQVEMRRMAIIEERSAMEFFEQEGLKKGIEQGIEKGKQAREIEIIQAMRAIGMGEEEINKIINLEK